MATANTKDTKNNKDTKTTKKTWYADDDTNWNTWWGEYHDPKQGK